MSAASGPISPRGCLYCLTDDGGFTSVEHPVPESLGNTELILQKGVVCDRCNHKELAGLDQCLADFMPLKKRRAELGIPNKKDKVPVARFAGGVRLRQIEGRAALTGETPEGWRLEGVDSDNPCWSVGIATLRGGRPLSGEHPREISRALLKVGFEAGVARARRTANGRGLRSAAGRLFVVEDHDVDHAEPLAQAPK